MVVGQGQWLCLCTTTMLVVMRREREREKEILVETCQEKQWVPRATKTHPDEEGGCDGGSKATEVFGDQVCGDAVVFLAWIASTRCGTVNGLSSALQVCILFFFGLSKE